MIRFFLAGMVGNVVLIMSKGFCPEVTTKLVSSGLPHAILEALLSVLGGLLFALCVNFGLNVGFTYSGMLLLLVYAVLCFGAPLLYLRLEALRIHSRVLTVLEVVRLVLVQCYPLVLLLTLKLHRH